MHVSVLSAIGTTVLVRCCGLPLAYLVFNSDFNYIRDDDECVPVGPEPIPAGVCEYEREEEKYMGSSEYRLMPGNTCEKGGCVVMDEPVEGIHCSV